MAKTFSQKSLRDFGLIWALVLGVIALRMFMKDNSSYLPVLAGALVMLTIAVTVPGLFARLYVYQGWLKFGSVLGKINSTLILLVLFYGIFTPIALTLRLMGKDLLHKKQDSNASSYFIPRQTPLGDMRNQF